MNSARFSGLAAALLLNSLALTAGPSPSERTAEYVRAHLEEFRNQEAELDVVFIKAADAKTSIPGHVLYHAVTYDTRLDVLGGTFPVVFPPAQEGDMVKKYGVLPEGGGVHGLKNPDSKKLKGWVVVSKNGQAVLDASGNAGSAIAKSEVAGTGARSTVQKRLTR